MRTLFSSALSEIKTFSCVSDVWGCSGSGSASTLVHTWAGCLQDFITSILLTAFETRDLVHFHLWRVCYDISVKGPSVNVRGVCIGILTLYSCKASFQESMRAESSHISSCVRFSCFFDILSSEVDLCKAQRTKTVNPWLFGVLRVWLRWDKWLSTEMSNSLPQLLSRVKYLGITRFSHSSK